MLEKILDPIFAPFRLIFSKIFQAQQLPAQIKGEVGRAKSEAAYIKDQSAGYAQSAKGAAQKAGAKPPVKKKMGLFSKKVACESCGQKLHPSWDECPYCGFKKGAAAGGAAPPSASGSAPQRTMALDLNAGPMAGTGMLGWLIPLEGSRIGELLELRGRVTVGSAADNTVAINEPSISGHHCEFVGSANGFKLNDLGSTNGTFVNDKKINTHDLIDNDNVRLGRIRFKFKSLS